MMTLLAGVAFLALAQNDKTRANSYDDAWESAWVAHCQTVLGGGSGKNTGFVLHVGDSITHANPYTQWLRYGAGKTAEDTEILTWCRATDTWPGSITPGSKNGVYLAATDVANRSMTAAGGISTDEFVSGTGNGGTAMPSETNTATAQGHVGNTAYTLNLHQTTVAAAFADAQFAVIMLGTNDVGGGRTVSTFTTDLTSIVDTFEGRNIVVILSTIPPRNAGDVTPFNAAIRSFAQSRGLPLIDYYAEILARRPGTTWQGTLISADGVHPTSDENIAGASEDPYASGGNASTHTTGSNAADSGYLLRSWLTAQKLKEVKAYMIDGAAPPGPGPAPGPAPGSPPAPGATASGVDDGDDEGSCSCGSIREAGLPLWAVLLAAVLTSIAFLRRR